MSASGSAGSPAAVSVASSSVVSSSSSTSADALKLAELQLELAKVQLECERVALQREQVQVRARVHASASVTSHADGAPSRGGLVLPYPSTFRSGAVDEYHGVRVPDPYRWLEDPESTETKSWVDKQNALTQAFLSTCGARDALKERLNDLQNYARFQSPKLHGSSYYYWKNDGLQDQYVMYQLDHVNTDDAKLVNERVFLDPNALTTDGTASVQTTKFSQDGSLLLYTVMRSGSDWATAHVMRADEARTQLDDKVEWVKFSSLSWTHDHRGFFYSRYPAPVEFANKDDKDFARGSETSALENHALYYHRLGTPQSEDVLVLATPDHPKWMIGGTVSNDGTTLLITIHESCDPVNRLFYMPLASDLSFTPAPIVKLIDSFDAEYEYVCNYGKAFYFKSNRNALRYKLIAIDLEKPDQAEWKDVVGEHPTDVLEGVAAVSGERLLLTYLHDVTTLIKIIDRHGVELVRQLPLPDLGSAHVAASHNRSEFFFHFSSFLYPGSVYRVQLGDVSNAQQPFEMTLFRESKLPGVNPHVFTTDQVRYRSKDGTLIPMFIVRRKDLVQDGSSPCFLYGYGGFNISMSPYFRVDRILWMQAFGGVYALPNLRGGGEFGESWHQAGTKLKKQNVFDDFQAAAEYLIDHKYTSASKLVINGGSNGGLLVAACVNQRPELYGAAVAEVGVLDMLKFKNFTIGHAWCSDYGDVANKDEFDALYAYSPVHNVPHDKKFPALLLLTADHDDRVVPLHSYKYIAEVQHRVGSQAQQVDAPLLIRIDVKAGHGAGKPLWKVVQQSADVFAFLARVLGVSVRV